MTYRRKDFKLYSTARWQARRKAQLQREPLCAMCDRPTPATIADHIEPHKGNEAAFWQGELQSLCKLHHDSTKAMLEKGKVRGCDRDGTPLDPLHHWHQG